VVHQTHKINILSPSLPAVKTETTMTRIRVLLVAALTLAEAFSPPVPTTRTLIRCQPLTLHERCAYSSTSRHDKRTSPLFISDNDENVIEVSADTLTEEEKAQAVGNLVANDEWEGLTMELSELIRTAVVEDIKSNAREFLGKDDYKVGDISKEVDSRVKAEVARMRGKEDYEIGDLVVVMDNMAKDMTSELTGKPYETGDLSKEIDKRVKGAVANFCGKEDGQYEFGDLSKEIDRRVKNRVSEYIGKDYEFGDITRQIETQRKAWVKDFLGEKAAEEYQVSCSLSTACA
jgi:hypothetical protein